MRGKRIVSKLKQLWREGTHGEIRHKPSVTLVMSS